MKDNDYDNRAIEGIYINHRNIGPNIDLSDVILDHINNNAKMKKKTHYYWIILIVIILICIGLFSFV